MSVQVKWKTIDVFSELSLTYEGNNNYYKNVHHPIPSLLVGTWYTLATFKTNQ